jgi:hypothetical protein
MVTFSHADARTDEAAWEGSGLDTIGELPLDSAELARTEFVVLVAHGRRGFAVMATPRTAHVC